jgi:hypothetical protein
MSMRDFFEKGSITVRKFSIKDIDGEVHGEPIDGNVHGYFTVKGGRVRFSMRLEQWLLFSMGSKEVQESARRAIAVCIKEGQVEAC